MDTEEEMQQAKADLREDEAPGNPSGAAGVGVDQKAVELVSLCHSRGSQGPGLGNKEESEGCFGETSSINTLVSTQ